MTITWTPPSLNTDGTALGNIASYQVLYGTSAGSLGSSKPVAGSTTTSAVIDGLTAGTWYFSVVVVNTNGSTSTPSAPVSRTLP